MQLRSWKGIIGVNFIINTQFQHQSCIQTKRPRSTHTYISRTKKLDFWTKNWHQIRYLVPFYSEPYLCQKKLNKQTCRQTTHGGSERRNEWELSVIMNQKAFLIIVPRKIGSGGNTHTDFWCRCHLEYLTCHTRCVWNRH